MITGEKLKEWQDAARRDDACTFFVPSDIRVMLGEIARLRDVLEWSENNCIGKCKGIIAAAQQARPLTTAIHAYRPHKNYPQFCDACGYGPDETLMHIQG